MKLLIYHHNDADGRLSAVIAALAWRKFEPSDAIVYRSSSYQSNHCFDGIGSDDAVAVVDYSFSDAEFAELRGKTSHITWIDHHASRKDSAHLDLPGLRNFTNKGPAACVLAWRYYFPTEELPRLVELIGDYDSWAMVHAPACVYLHEAVKADQRLESPFAWRELLQPEGAETISNMLREGRAMVRYRDGYCAGMRKSVGHHVELDARWGDHKTAYALNVYGFGSAAFGDEVMAHEPFVLAYAHDGNEFHVSLYSTNPGVDCGALAKVFGGGGHRGAAGFRCLALPWKRGE